jgi:pimeloyl-ACP methyl ester carboxylesterase
MDLNFPFSGLLGIPSQLTGCNNLNIENMIISIMLFSGNSYQEINKPEYVPPEFSGGTNILVRYYQLRNDSSGHTINGSLWQPNEKKPRETTVILGMHGTLGNYFSATIGFLFQKMVARGFAFFGINMRYSNLVAKDQLVDNFYDSYSDILTSVQFLKNLGYRNIIIMGHSMGTLHATYFCAINHDTSIVGMVISGPFADLPSKTRKVLIHDADSYRKLHRYSADFIRNNRPNDLLPLEMGFLENRKIKVTAINFYTYRDTSGSRAVSRYWIKFVSVPVLILRDSGDQIILPNEPLQLLRSAKSSGSLPKQIEYYLIPNEKGPNPNGHQFLDNQDQLAARIEDWYLRVVNPN